VFGGKLSENQYLYAVYCHFGLMHIPYTVEFININQRIKLAFKGELSDSFTNYNNVGNTKVSVSIKKTYANKCTLSEIFLTEILKSFSGF